jgi:hypothetical protein
MMLRNETRIVRKQSRYLTTVVAIAVLLLGAQATSWAAGGSDPGATPAAEGDRAAPGPNAAATALGPTSMDQSYSARETKSKGLETFKGGDVVIIGSGALVIVLLVLLILVVA